MVDGRPGPGGGSLSGNMGMGWLRLFARVSLDRHGPLASMAGMAFAWDDARNDACFERRGFDVAYAVGAFFDPQRIVVLRHAMGRWRGPRPDDRHDRPPHRVVVDTVRGSAVRIMSARKANAKEVADHEHNAYQD